MNEEVTIYTDGACSPNPGNGGWAAILIFDENTKQEISGGLKDSTNNQAEMMAVLKGLQALTSACDVTIYSDSLYVVKSIGEWLNGQPKTSNHGWIVKWYNNNWSKKDGKLKNIDLWKQIHIEVMKHKSVHLKWVRGHTDNEYNNRCDTLAVEARKAIK